LYVAVYRLWLGLAPLPPAHHIDPRVETRGNRAVAKSTLDPLAELVVLSVKKFAARCRFLGSDHVVSLRTSRVRDLVPGEIITLRPSQQWPDARHARVSGDVEGRRIDVAALELASAALDECGVWDPEEEYWGEEGEPIEEWAREIIARGPRPLFELEQVLPGEDPDDPFADPILESNDLKEAGDVEGARKILMDLCQSDLRCLDAHAHLGNLVFDEQPEKAARHYEVGVRVGELSLGKDFDGVLAWGFIYNRPFLRCMHGYGLCLWRLGRFDEAERLFERMLWLNPDDNQGIRLLLPLVREGDAWKP
jgi:tetratricopeptide (TPR) repeat protein